MSRYVTLGADERGEVYGLELNDDGTWRRNSLEYPTNCVVVMPMSKRTYEYVTEDPASAKDLWQSAVADDQTELGLREWFDTLDSDDLLDTSFVFELLDDNDNPTVAAFDRPYFGSFRAYVEHALVKSDGVPAISTADDAYEWEAGGWFPPSRPFAVEFAPKALLEEYYAHLRETSKEWRDEESGN